MARLREFRFGPALGGILGLAACASGPMESAAITTGASAVGDFVVPVESLADRRFATVVRQKYDFSCGSAALATLLRYHYGLNQDEEAAFRGMWASGNRDQIRRVGFSLLDMKRHLAKVGLQADGCKGTLEEISKAGVPGIALGLGILSLWILIPGGLYGTLWILLLAYVTAHIPIAMQFVSSALHRIHTDLEDASRISGQNMLGTISRIDLPLMRPALIGSWLLMYVVILREISLVILLYNPSTVVLSVGLMDVWGSGFYPELAVYSLLLMVLGLVPVALLSRFAKFTAD